MLYIINSSVIYIYIYSSLSMATVIVLGCTFRLSNFEPLLYYAHTHTHRHMYIYHTQRHTNTNTHAQVHFLFKFFSWKFHLYFLQKSRFVQTLYMCVHLHLCILCADACACKCPLRLEVNPKSCFLGTAHLTLGGGLSHYDLELRSQLGWLTASPKDLPVSTSWVLG